MLTLNKTKKKGIVSLSHRGRVANTDITLRVNDNQRSFIEKNIKNIHFDVNTLHFYLRNYTPSNGKKTAKPFKKLSLNKAIWLEQTGELPTHRLPSLTMVA
jgi:hypothetical protein